MRRPLLLAVLVLFCAAPAAHAHAGGHPVLLRGTYLVVHEDAPATVGESGDRTLAFLATAAGRVELTRGLRFRPGARVELSGTALAGGEVAPADTTRLAAAPAPDPTTGVRRVLVIRTTWASQAQPVDDATAASVVSGIGSWYAQASYGQVSVTGAVTPVLAIADPGGCSDADVTSIEAEAKAAAQANGYVLSDYTNLMTVIPDQYCAWAGLGYIGGPDQFTWIRGDQLAGASVRTPVHELGHNFGLDHTNGLECTDVETAGCATREYYDPFDAMGLAWDGVGQFSAFQKQRLGWMAGRVDTVTDAPGQTLTLELAPFETSSPGGDYQAVHVTGATRTYWIEYRTPSGSDAFAHRAPAGVYVHAEADPGAPLPGPSLLDLHPASSVVSGYGDSDYDRMLDSALLAGQSFVTETGVQVQATAEDAGGATITVTTGQAVPDTVPPSTPVLASPANGSVSASGAVTLAWNASTDAGSGVQGYTVYLDNTPLSPSLDATTTQLTTGVLADGIHRWTVSATDAAGNASGRMSARSFVVDGTPPAAPALDTPRTGAIAPFAKPVFAWFGSSDAGSGIAAYRLLVDGATAATVDASATSAQPPASLADGPHTWTIAAVDRAGNAAAAAPRRLVVDVHPPAAFTRLAPGARASTRRPRFRWSASSDAGSGVAGYRLYVDGHRLASTSPGTRSARPSKALSRGSHKWYVEAVDRAGHKRRTTVGTVKVT